PAANTAQHGPVLPAPVAVAHDVAAGSGPRLDPEQLTTTPLVHGFQIAFQRAVEDNAAGGCQRAGPNGELLRLRPDDLALARIPGDEIAHSAVAVRGREHRDRRPNIGLARRIGHPERLVVHADVVCRHITQLGPVLYRGQPLYVGAAVG